MPYAGANSLVSNLEVILKGITIVGCCNSKVFAERKLAARCRGNSGVRLAPKDTPLLARKTRQGKSQDELLLILTVISDDRRLERNAVA